MPPEERRLRCGSGEEPWPNYKAITTIKDTPDYGIDERAEPFALTVMQAAAAAFGLDDPAARQHLIELLDRWADGRAFTKLQPPSDNAYYAVERSLLPVIVAYWLVHDAPEMSRDRSDRIAAWIDGLVERSALRRKELDQQSRVANNNHSYLNASVIMAWAALYGKLGGLQLGVEAYRQALATMRDDGSLPLETDRGARALWYQRHALASLVTMAEIAAVKNIDLYGLEAGAGTIHLAVQFLLEGIEDPGIVRPYALDNFSPAPDTDPGVQDLGFLEPRGHGRHYMAWIEPYISRFPNHPNSQRLSKLILNQAGSRPLIDDYSGGNMSCLFASMAEAAQPRSNPGPKPVPRPQISANNIR